MPCSPIYHKLDCFKFLHEQNEKISYNYIVYNICKMFDVYYAYMNKNLMKTFLALPYIYSKYVKFN